MNLELVTAAIVAVLAVIVVRRLLGGGKMSSKVVSEQIKAGAVIIDVRSPEEFRDGAYPGALNVPLQELARRMAQLPKDKPIVLYCASGARSAMAARTMKLAGFNQVVNAGGLDDMPR